MNDVMSTQLKTRELNQPREHHTLFAHQVLPAAFYSAPDRFMALLTEQGHNLLRLWWQRVAEYLEETDWLSAHGLGYRLRPLGDNASLVLITFPPPQNITEAYFAALVYRPAQLKNSLWHSAPAYTRYFTLEIGLDPAGHPRPILGEWLATGRRLDHGDGPPPEAELFIEAVRRRAGAS
jgi:hypothetical protein